MPTVRELRQQAAARLSQAGRESASLEADVLLSFLLKVSRSYLLAHPEFTPADAIQLQLADVVRRCCAGEPIAYITGEREFWSLTFDVSPAVLIPRPETELLVEKAIEFGDALAKQQVVIADLGTGSGAIAISIASARPHWKVYATEMSMAALALAQRNAARHQVTNLTLRQGNWCEPLADKSCDIIISNPPYLSEAEWPVYEAGLRYEPRAALVSGVDGLDAIRDICQSTKRCLRPNGYLLLEHGFAQAASVQQILIADGYRRVQTLNDLAGIQRITVAEVPAKWLSP